MSDKTWRELAQKLDEKNKVGPEQLSIWGGRCDKNTLPILVKKWLAKSDLPYRIWHCSSKITFGIEASPPQEMNWLERARLFGGDGDLSIRREGGEFRWWFVGPASTDPPEEFDSDEANFWKAEPEAKFYENAETSLLWGERRADGDEQWWFEDRVANADLTYPVDGTPGRVQIEYKTYSRAGRVEFTWLTKLSKWEGANNERKD